MRSISLILLFLSACTSLTDVTPTVSQQKWQEAELGAIFHYDLHVFDGERYVQTANRETPIEDCNIFYPSSLNTDQWVQSAKAAGCRFALLTATHETGFGLWQSDTNPYCLKALNWRDGKGDIVGDFVKSCRKYGVEPGIYIGIRWNSHLGIGNFKPREEGPTYEERKAWYKHYCEQLVEEICTRYGPLFMVWFDGGADDPDGSYWVPAMADVPLRSYNGRHEWFWEPDDEGSILPLDKLLEIYQGSVGRNATLILGLTPDPDGLIPEPDRARLEEFGRCVENLYAHPAANASGEGLKFKLKVDRSRPVDRCIISEDISRGERIRKYRIEAETSDGWVSICEGQSVGHKRIESFPAICTSELRLLIEQNDGTPVLKEFSVFYQ